MELDGSLNIEKIGEINFTIELDQFYEKAERTTMDHPGFPESVTWDGYTIIGLTDYPNIFKDVDILMKEAFGNDEIRKEIESEMLRIIKETEDFD